MILGIYLSSISHSQWKARCSETRYCIIITHVSFFETQKLSEKQPLTHYTVWAMNTECEISTLISIKMMVIEGGEINTNIWIGVYCCNVS